MNGNININKELEALILKYKIDAGVYHFQYRISQVINEVFNSFSNEMCIAVRGAGEHTEKLLQILSKENRKKILYIIDKNVNIDNFQGIEVVSTESMLNKDIDIFIISSFKYRIEMARELFSLKHCLNEDFQVIDLYEILQERGISCNQPFYVRSLYGKELYVLRQYYMQNNQQFHMEPLLSKIIAAYLEVKDFINAKKYIDLYIGNHFEKSKTYQDFWAEFECLLGKIKSILKSRQQRDIIWNWIDALRYEEMEEISYLKKFKNSSLFFENAYCVMGATNMSMAMIMTNQLVIDDKLYSLDKYDDKVLLMNYLGKNGYDFQYIGGHASTLKKLLPKNKRYSLFLGDFYEISCSQLQWEAWNVFIQSEKPVCACIHNSVETHRPFWGNDNLTYLSIKEHEMEKYKEATGMQLIAARSYLEEQLEWYQNAYGKYGVNIFMSDHGKAEHYLGEYPLGIQYEMGNHILMMISGKGIEPCIENRFYQGNKFYHIIRYIIENKNYDDALSEYVLTQFLDIYNDKFLEKLLEQEGENIRSRIQNRGCRTQTEYYIQYADGREEYVDYQIGLENLADHPQYRNRMDELKKLAGSCFINVFEDEFFVAARKLYKFFHLVYDNGRYIQENLDGSNYSGS